MRTIIEVREIECKGCAKPIDQEVGAIRGVYGVSVDVANKKIKVDHTENVTRRELILKLRKKGFPVIDRSEDL